jgi:hypothetical protein
MIDTKTVDDRRPLRFKAIDEMLADVERVAAAEKAGTLRRTGNWTTGQIFGHLSAWIDYGYDGAPIKPPWFVRVFGRMVKKKYLRGPLQAGFRIPNVEGGTFGIGALPLEEGLSRLLRSLERLRAAPPTQPSAIFGPLSHEEWVQLHLRHAELHLSFLHPD